MYKANEQTIEMTSFGIEGHIIDHSWYHILKKPTKKDPIGKTDSTAVILLADIFYWHKPSHFVDKDSGIHSIGKKFQSDLLQRSYAQIETQFGFSKDQARDSFELLESLGIVERVFRDEIIKGQKVANIMYIKFNNIKLQALMNEYYESKSELKKIITSSEISDDPLGKNPLPPRKKPTYTETSPKTSPKNDDDGMKASPSKLKIKFLDGREELFSKEDLFSLAVSSRSDWGVSDIDYLFLKLESYTSQITDLKKLCDKILFNKSKAERAEKYSNNMNPSQKSERYIPEHEKTPAVPQKNLKTWAQFEQEKKNKSIET